MTGLSHTTPGNGASNGSLADCEIPMQAFYEKENPRRGVRRGSLVWGRGKLRPGEKAEREGWSAQIAGGFARRKRVPDVAGEPLPSRDHGRMFGLFSAGPVVTLSTRLVQEKY